MPDDLFAAKPFTCMVEGCGKTFFSKAAKGQHRVEAHGKTPKTAFRNGSAAQRRARRKPDA